MKIHYASSHLSAWLMVLLLPLAACNASNDKATATTASVTTSEIKPNVIQRDTLTANQIARIKVIHKTFSEVDNSTLDEMLTNFRKDRNPDSEIKVWEDMGNAYTKFTAKSGAKLDLTKKQEAFKLILLRSSMTAAEANQELNPQVLTPKEIEEILSYYVADPQPVTVAK